MTHELKILPIWFDDVSAYRKNFEIRRNDRDFEIGDILLLKEWNRGRYTGRECFREIEYIYYGDGTYGLSDEYCILGLVGGGEGESCYLTKEQVEKRLWEWDAYQSGKIRRPKWVLNKFINDMDRACVFSGEPSLGLPQYPTLWHSDKKRYSLYGHIDYDDARKYGYRDGYRDAKEGKDEKY